MIIGAHTIISSKDPEADRAFFRDVLKFPSVDVGGSWLIFGLPPSEVAIHPSEKNNVHEFYLMCANIEDLVAKLGKQGVKCGPVQNPGGGKLGVYQPRHVRPRSMPVRKTGKRVTRGRKRAGAK